MSAKSTYYNRAKINPDIKTAIIYSVDYLFSYIVEINDGNKSYFITNKDNEPVKFGNMADARKAAAEEKVEQAYLALNKTDEENDISTCHADHQNRYDYSPVVLSAKK